jgi:hypothetical protein
MLIFLVYLTMKTAIYLIITCFISTGAFLAALGAKHPFLLYAAGFGMWAWFLWGLSRRTKKRAAKREREEQFLNFMRYQNRNFPR